MADVFLERHPKPFRIPAIITLHNLVLMHPVLAIAVEKEAIVATVNKVVVQSCVKARRGYPSIGKEVK
ncbi:Nn.00g079770.m01.CDS01 [Neocucurbitaria sp. VM-36]